MIRRDDKTVVTRKRASTSDILGRPLPNDGHAPPPAESRPLNFHELSRRSNAAAVHGEHDKP